MTSQKFDNNLAYKAFKAKPDNMGMWAKLCPAEKIQLISEEPVMYADTTYESRWGHHPCDKETYFKLKELQRCYWEAVRAEHEWERWNRKDPQNRVIREKIRDEKGRITGSNVIGPRPEPVRSKLFYKTYKVPAWNGSEREVTTFEYADIVTDCRKARTPVADPNKVPKLSLTIKEIDNLINQIQLDKAAA